MGKRWVVAPENISLQNKYAKEFEIPTITAQVLVNRGLRQVNESSLFLYGKLSQLHDPFIFSGMKTAVDRVFKAIKGKEKITLYGDYDVDGATTQRFSIFLLPHLWHFVDCEPKKAFKGLTF